MGIITLKSYAAQCNQCKEFLFGGMDIILKYKRKKDMVKMLELSGWEYDEDTNTAICDRCIEIEKRNDI